MQVMLTCPCGWEFWTEKPAPGQAVRCPHCGRAMTPYPVEEGDGAETQTPTQPAEESAQGPHESGTGPSADSSSATPTTPPPSSYTHPPVGWSQPGAYASAGRVPPPYAPPMPPRAYPRLGSEEPKPSAGLAIASMVLGIISVLLCPCSYGLITIPIATTAVIMGVISIAKKRGGKGFAIAGVSTGSVGIAIGLVAVAFLVFVVNSAMRASSAIATATATMPAVAAGGSYYSDDSSPGSVPSVMTAQQIRDAFAAPAARKPISSDGALWLRRALNAYEKRCQQSSSLRDCVLYFRRYLKCEGLARPADAEQAEKFDTACDELTDRFLDAYRNAGQLEQDGKWEIAKNAYEALSWYSLEPESPLAKNIEAHRVWCGRKQRDKEDKGAGSDFELE